MLDVGCMMYDVRYSLNEIILGFPAGVYPTSHSILIFQSEYIRYHKSDIKRYSLPAQE